MSEVLRLEDVRVRRRGALVLDGASLSVANAEIVVVEGAHGSGKSTLIAAAAAMVRLDGGAVFIGDRDVTTLQPASLPYVRRNLGYLPADPPFVERDSAAWNVALGGAARGERPADALEEARTVLRDLDLGGVAEEPVSTLSTGMRRLVALGRALVGAPPLLVLDDPLAGVSPDALPVVARALRRARDEGAAVLAAASDARVLAAAIGDVVVVKLEGGRVAGGKPRISLVADSAELQLTTDDLELEPIDAPATGEGTG